MRKACACYLALFRIRRKESDSRDMVNAMHDAPFSKCVKEASIKYVHIKGEGGYFQKPTWEFDKICEQRE